MRRLWKRLVDRRQRKRSQPSAAPAVQNPYRPLYTQERRFEDLVRPEQKDQKREPEHL